MIELPVIALLISLTGSVVGFLTWQRKDERDRYSKERELTHALDNFAAVKTSVNQLEDRVDEGFQQVTVELSQVKTILMLNQRMIAESNGIDLNSTQGRRLTR